METGPADHKSWFKRHPALTFWLVIFAIYLFAIATDEGGAGSQKVNTNNYLPSRTYIPPPPSPPTYEAPTYYQNPTTHYDSDYKYEYRTGYSGNYGYNYDVSGYGDTGFTYGNIDTSGKYGEGYLYDEDGNEVYVETEWTDYGVMEAYDENGNYYELEVD